MFMFFLFPDCVPIARSAAHYWQIGVWSCSAIPGTLARWVHSESFLWKRFESDAFEARDFETCIFGASMLQLMDAMARGIQNNSPVPNVNCGCAKGRTRELTVTCGKTSRHALIWLSMRSILRCFWVLFSPLWMEGKDQRLKWKSRARPLPPVVKPWFVASYIQFGGFIGGPWDFLWIFLFLCQRKSWSNPPPLKKFYKRNVEL